MHHYASKTQQFYKAFYHWTLLTSPALGSEYPPCLHTYRRGIASAGLNGHASPDDHGKTAGEEAVGFRISKHSAGRSGADSERIAAFERARYFHNNASSQDHKSDAEGQSIPRHRQHGVVRKVRYHNDQIQDDQVQDDQMRDDQPRIRFSNIRPGSTSHGKTAWLSDPVRTWHEKPSDSLRPWEEVIRYRAPNTIMLEIALPVVAAQRTLSRYGEDMRRLAEETGARLELGAAYRVEGMEKELQSVAVSGTFEQVSKVCEVFQKDKTVGRLRAQLQMKETGAGSWASDDRLRNVAGATTAPEPIAKSRKQAESRVKSNDLAAGANATLVTEAIRQLRKKKTLLESQQSDVAPASIALSERPVDADTPFRRFDPWQFIVRSRDDAGNVVVEQAIPHASLGAMKIRYGPDLVLLQLRHPLAKIIILDHLVLPKSDQVLVFVAVSGPDTQVAAVLDAFNYYQNPIHRDLSHTQLEHWRHAVGMGIRKGLPLRSLMPWEVTLRQQRRRELALVELAVPADVMQKLRLSPRRSPLFSRLNQLYPKNVEVLLGNANEVIVNDAGQEVVGAQIRYPLSEARLGTSVVAEMRLAAETEPISKYLEIVVKMAAARKDADASPVDQDSTPLADDVETTNTIAPAMAGGRNPSAVRSNQKRVAANTFGQTRSLATLAASRSAAWSFMAATSACAHASCRQLRAYSTASQEPTRVAWKWTTLGGESAPQEFTREVPIPTAILHLIQKQHGENFQKLQSKYAGQQARIQLGETNYEGFCYVDGPTPEYGPVELSSVIITANDQELCKRILGSFLPYKSLNLAVIGRGTEEAIAEAEREWACQKWKSFWDRPVIAESEMESKAVEMGTFVVRKRPRHQPPAQRDFAQDYFAAAADSDNDHTWIIETVLPQVQWDYINRRKDRNVEALARDKQIEIQVAEESFEAPVPGNAQGKIVPMRSAKLVGPLEQVYQGLSRLSWPRTRWHIQAALGEITKSKLSMPPKANAKGGFTVAQEASEPAPASQKADRAAHGALRIKKVRSEPQPDKEAQDATNIPELSPEPEVVTTRLQIAGDTPAVRALNAGKLFGSNSRTLGRLRSKTDCNIARIGAKEDGLFELTGTLDSVRRATQGIRDLVGTRKLSTSEELDLIKAAETQMQNDMKTILRPLTHPVVIITSRMPRQSGAEDPQPRKLVEQYRGVTVSSFNTVTLGSPGPAIISFNLKVPSRTWDAIALSRYMCVHILSATPTAAAAAQLFTKPYDKPEEPFKLLYEAGGFVGCKQERSVHGVPEIRMAGVVLARVKARLMKEKCVHVADHCVVLAKVEGVEFAPEIMKEMGDGSFAIDRISEGEARGKVEQAMGLAYAKRGYRCLGEEVDAGALPAVRQWTENHDQAAPSQFSGEAEFSEDDGASMSSPDAMDGASPPHATSTAQGEKSDYMRTMEDNPALERIEQDLSVIGVRADEPAAGETTAAEDLGRSQRKVVQDEEDDYDLGFIRKSESRGPELRQELDSILGPAGNEHAPRKANRPLLPSGAREFCTMPGRRQYSTVATRPVDKANVKHKEAPSEPSDCVADTSILTQSVNEFLGLPPTSAREVPPMRALLKAQQAAASATQQLKDALLDGSLTHQQSLTLESEIATNERKVAKQLALRANHDLKKMLDTGKVDFRRVGWLEQTVEKGMAVVVEEARLLRGMFDRGEIDEVVFAKAKAKLEQRHGELNEGAMRLRGMVEEEDEGF